MTTTQLTRRPHIRSAPSSAPIIQDAAAEAVPRCDAAITPRRRRYLLAKAVVEYVAAAVMLVVLLPVIVIAALLIKLTSRGPVFYVQTRVGKDGRHFPLIKLRTMVQDAEAATGPVWASRNDPRVTPVGALLRATHIDEFPQLINVLLGQMALIGPRPERPEFVSDLRTRIPHYEQRLNVKPGITGLAQLNLPPDTDFNSVRRKVLHDLYYIRFLGPWLDLQILLVTAWQLLKSLIAFAWRTISLPTTDHVNARVEPLVIGRESLSPANGVRK